MVMYVSPSLFDNWRAFTHKAKNPRLQLYCQNHSFSATCLKAFNHYSHIAVEVDSVEHQDIEYEQVVDNYNYQDTTDLLKLTFDPADHIVYSFASNTQTVKGMDDDMLASTQSLFQNYYRKNLGDTRSFYSADDLIDKIEYLRTAKAGYFSKCSWVGMATVFKVPHTVLQQIYPHRSKW
jgi:hypothetical protein